MLFFDKRDNSQFGELCVQCVCVCVHVYVCVCE